MTYPKIAGGTYLNKGCLIGPQEENDLTINPKYPYLFNPFPSVDLRYGNNSPLSYPPNVDFSQWRYTDKLGKYSSVLVDTFTEREQRAILSLQYIVETSGYDALPATFTGQKEFEVTPMFPTATVGDDSNYGATTEFVTRADTILWDSTVTAIAGKQDALGFTPENAANKGVANGYAGLDSSGRVPASMLPAYVDEIEEYPTVGDFPATGNSSTLYLELEFGKLYRWGGTQYVGVSDAASTADTSTRWAIPRTVTLSGKAAGSTSFDGSTDFSLEVTSLTVNKADVGLANVDNTSDADKPISTAAQTALDTKQNLSGKGVANGYASLGADAKVPAEQLPVMGAPPVKIAVIGDSLSTQNYAMPPAWPTMLQQDLRQSGVNAHVYNCAVAGHTFYRANTTASFGTNTAVQQAIAHQPDIVIIALGLNDILNALDGRSLATVQSDAAAMVSALVTALPDVKILYMGERAYDAANYPTPGTSLANKGTLGYYYQKKTSGILTGLWTSELLDDQVSATTKSRMADWITLDAYIQGLADVDHSAYMELWKIHRLGGNATDMLHLNAGGSVLQASTAVQGLQNAAFSSVIPRWLVNNNATRNNVDSLFSSAFTASGTNWLYSSNGDALAVIHSLQLRPLTWYLPLPATLLTSHYTGVDMYQGDRFTRVIQNAKPNTAVQVSTNGAAFSAAGSVVTDSFGAQMSGSTFSGLRGLLNFGSHTFRYKVDDIVLGPVTFSLVDSSDVVTLTGATTLSISHAYKQIKYNSSGTANLTIPPESSVDWPDDTIIEFLQYGTGAFTLAAGAGVTLRLSAASATSAGQYKLLGIKKIGANEWLVY